MSDPGPDPRDGDDDGAPTDPRRDPRRDQPGVDVDHLERLWAPWRSGYLTGDGPIDGCPFCVLPARASSEDRRSLIVHRGEHAFVVGNAYPYNPGHVMVVPYAHEADLTTLAEAAAAEVWTLARRTVAVLRTVLGARGVNLGMNLGAAGGAGIADHLHLHAVPRWPGDTNFVTVVGGARVLPKALLEVHDQLVAGFA